VSTHRNLASVAVFHLRRFPRPWRLTPHDPVPDVSPADTHGVCTLQGNSRVSRLARHRTQLPLLAFTLPARRPRQTVKPDRQECASRGLLQHHDRCRLIPVSYPQGPDPSWAYLEVTKVTPPRFLIVREHQPSRRNLGSPISQRNSPFCSQMPRTKRDRNSSPLPRFLISQSSSRGATGSCAPLDLRRHAKGQADYRSKSTP